MNPLQSEALGAVLPGIYNSSFIGYLAGRKLTLDVSTLSKTCLYILTPALTFNSLANSKVELSGVWRLALAAFLVPLILAPVFLWLFRRLGWEANLSRSMLLPSIFSNTGNYGLPICLFCLWPARYGPGCCIYGCTKFSNGFYPGRILACLSKLEPKQALGKVIRMPTLYGALLGMTVKALEIQVPLVIARPVGLFGPSSNLCVPACTGAQAGKQQTNTSMADSRNCHFCPADSCAGICSAWKNCWA